MPANVEIKARVHNIEKLEQAASELSGGNRVVIQQEDTFFNVPNGRLKLRKLKGEKSQLIYYSRIDQEGPKFCDYKISYTYDPEGLEATLGAALGIKGKVKKTRYLYMVGQTRVHVDDVEGLGNFMELEVVLKEGQSVEEGQAIANNLMTKLGVESADLISCAYMDLILNKNEN